MPFIDTKVSVELSKDSIAALKKGFGKIIEDIPGKSESWLMLNVEDKCDMAFKGTDAPCAMVDVHIFGPASDEAYDKLTKDACELVSKNTGIAKDRIYIKYSEYSHWGWNSMNF